MKILPALLLASLASAETADEVLAVVDRTMFGFADQIFDNTMRVVEPDGSVRERRFRTWQRSRGDDTRRLVRFLAPADVKGMAVLVEDRDTIYVYLPAYERVRRVAGHARAQSFLGSDMTYDDMGDIRLAGSHTPRLVSETDEAWLVELTPRKPDESAYAKQKMWVSKKYGHFTRVEYYDASGKHAKTMTQSDFVFREKEKVWSPTKVVMTDHRRNDHRTEVDVAVVAINSGLSESLFSQRSLARGE